MEYLARPGATGEERAGAFFDARDDQRDAGDLPRAWARDRHHWRLIVSPEDAAELDLKQYVRDYAERLERELGTRLEWVATVHRNTGQPHAHLVIRGLRDDGRDLVIPREVVSYGLRGAAEDVATRALGERSEREADAYLSRLAEAGRWTELDAILVDLARPAGRSGAAAGWADVAVPRSWSPDLAGRHHLDRRLEVLAATGLAERTSPPFRRAKYRVRADLAERLDRLARPEVERESGADRARPARVATPTVGRVQRTRRDPATAASSRDENISRASDGSASELGDDGASIG